MMATVAVLALPLIAAWCVVRLVPALTTGERLACAVAGSIAMPSVAFWLWRAVGGGPAGYAAADSWLWAALALACVLAGRRGGHAAARRLPLPSPAFAATASVAALIAVAVAARYVRVSPYGAWDAWAIWNLRARFLAASDMTYAFDEALAWSHPDYPLLVPAAVARAWVAADAFTQLFPLAIGVACGIGSVVAVAASLYGRRTPLMAAVAAALVAVPEFLRQSASQLADVPLAFFTVLAVTLVAVPSPGSARFVLAGAALGCAAWTKNEGVVVALAFPAIYLTIAARRQGLRAAVHLAADLAIGLVPMLVILALFKILVAPSNDVVDGIMRPGVFNYWLDEVRVAFVLRYMASEALRWGGWWPAAGPLLAVIAIALVHRKRHTGASSGTAAAGWLLLLLLLLFVCVYVMTPHSVAWHLQTSWSRLIAQLWPTLVWWACSRSGLGTPHEGQDRSPPLDTPLAA